MSWLAPRGHGRGHDRGHGHGHDDEATSYAVYRFDGNRAGDLEDARFLLTTVRAGRGRHQKYVDETAQRGRTYTYVVTALDRLWNESRPARGTLRG